MDAGQGASRAVWQRQISGEQHRLRAIRGAALQGRRRALRVAVLFLADVQSAHPARNAWHRIKSGAFAIAGRSVNMP